jgi:hypothetical protein
LGSATRAWGYTRIQGALRSLTLKSDTKIKGIRVVEGDHDVDGMGVMLQGEVPQEVLSERGRPRTRADAVSTIRARQWQPSDLHPT